MSDPASDNDHSDEKAESALVARVAASDAGKRLDAVAAALFSMYSRRRLQAWIGAALLTVDGQPRRTRDRLLGGESLRLTLPAEATDSAADSTGEDAWVDMPAEDLPLSIVFEDEHIMVIDKPAGLVMHPAPGNRSGTLVNALLHHDPALRAVPRAGVVHRLDKETSGLCVVARSLVAHTHLVRQLQARAMGREYLAVVVGDPAGRGKVDAPIARHPKDRKRMAVVESGKPAVTHFRVMERFPGAALLALKLETGRTHQIRVHMKHIGLPLIGDPDYGRRRNALPARLAAVPGVEALRRQALHATRLTLVHPGNESTRVFESPPPADFALVVEGLRVVTRQVSGASP